MKTTNLITVFFVGIIPEILVANYFKDIWNVDFFQVLFYIYTILILLLIGKTIISEIFFRLFVRKNLEDNIYKILVENKFPNPWNYYELDGLSYFDEVGRDVNGEVFDNKVINYATMIYSQVKTMYDLNKLVTYFRFKNILKIVVKKFMDNNFNSYIDDLNIDSENLLEKFKNYGYPNPKKYKNDGLGYLDFLISEDNISLSGKSFAIKLRKVIEIKYNLLASYSDGDNQDEIHYKNLLQQIEDAILTYSKEF